MALIVIPVEAPYCPSDGVTMWSKLGYFKASGYKKAL